MFHISSPISWRISYKLACWLETSSHCKVRGKEQNNLSQPELRYNQRVQPIITCINYATVNLQCSSHFCCSLLFALRTLQSPRSSNFLHLAWMNAQSRSRRERGQTVTSLTMKMIYRTFLQGTFRLAGRQALPSPFLPPIHAVTVYKGHLIPYKGHFMRLVEFLEK